MICVIWYVWKRVYEGYVNSDEGILGVSIPYMERERIGNRWRTSWRPYYWWNYGWEPIWVPAGGEGKSYERLSREYIPECVEKSYGECRGGYYQENCMRRSYGKCIRRR